MRGPSGDEGVELNLLDRYALACLPKTRHHSAVNGLFLLLLPPPPSPLRQQDFQLEEVHRRCMPNELLIVVKNLWLHSCVCEDWRVDATSEHTRLQKCNNCAIELLNGIPFYDAIVLWALW